jgi:hypothetical protein
MVWLRSALTLDDSNSSFFFPETGYGEIPRSPHLTYKGRKRPQNTSDKRVFILTDGKSTDRRIPSLAWHSSSSGFISTMKSIAIAGAKK